MNNAQLITYYDHIQVPKNTLLLPPNTISHDDLDMKYASNKTFFTDNAFIEAFTELEHLRLYFDFDSISNPDELDEALSWLDSLKSVFGEYTYSGYSNDPDIADLYNLRFIEGNKHYISMHIIFYQTMITSQDLLRIMHHTNVKGFTTEGVSRFCDSKVYKPIGSRQMFRFGLSDKIHTTNPKSPNYKDNVLNHADIIVGGDSLPSNHVIHTRGNERLIKEGDWIKVFKITDKQTEKTIKQEIKRDINELQPGQVIFSHEDLSLKHDLISLSDEELFSLLKLFPPEHDNLSNIVINVFHSPLNIESTIPIVESWYNQRIHTNPCPVRSYAKYADHVESNKWFYSIIKHIEDPITKQYWLDKVKDRYVDDSIEICPTDNFDLTALKKKNYRNENNVGLRMTELINDLKRILIRVEGKNTYVLKVWNSKLHTYEFKYHDRHTIVDAIEEHSLGSYYKEGKKKDIQLIDVIKRNLIHFTKRDIEFYSDEPDIYSIFHGFNFPLINKHNINYNLIQPFIDHIKYVICDNNEELSTYVINWLSFIFQNPGKQNGIALVIVGEQGTGKNFFTKIIGSLLGCYVNLNVNRIDQITGRFNTCIENKMLVICNELDTADGKIKADYNALKSRITEPTIDFDEKFKPLRENSQNVSNFILMSNNVIPVRIESGDRHYVVMKTSMKHKDDESYFSVLENLYHSTEFKTHLLSYFRTNDISGYSPRMLPMTETKFNIQEASKDVFQSFIADNYEHFIKGFERDSAWIEFERYRINNNESMKNGIKRKTFNTHMLNYCTEVRFRKYDGSRPRGYRLQETYLERFKPVDKTIDEINLDNDFDANVDNANI